MHILKPDLADPKLRAKRVKGMGHNYYGEPAWPNDLLYIFPVVILGTIARVVGLAVLDPAMLGDKANRLPRRWKCPEWYLYLSSRFCASFPTSFSGSLCRPSSLWSDVGSLYRELNKFQPFRCPKVMAAPLLDCHHHLSRNWCCSPDRQSLTLGLCPDHR